MSDDAELRDEVKRIVRRHDPEPGELRALADDLDALADRWDAVDDAL